MFYNTDGMKIDISVLILTHNRQKQFERCLESVAIAQNTSGFKYNIEILVNNDTSDICEYYAFDIPVKYYYKSSDNLSVLYKHLFDEAKGKFIYFLEDDDYMLPEFFNSIDLNYDFNFLNFKLFEIREAIEEKRKPFKIPDTNTHFQLSQLFFKKELIKDFPDGNNLDNDWKLLEQLRSYEHKLIPQIMFVQTKDAGDNISDKNLNKDPRWPIRNNMA